MYAFVRQDTCRLSMGVSIWMNALRPSTIALILQHVKIPRGALYAHALMASVVTGLFVMTSMSVRLAPLSAAISNCVETRLEGMSAYACPVIWKAMEGASIATNAH
tara:strand:- start:85 stop:402 length:318 start_codon:yes stop_codon:yes gene_type:complete